jgi:4-amino-4-deoxy-L-arabinose transferase-like glycosyltransferase
MRDPRRAAAAVFAAALAVRLAYLATARGPAFDDPLGDADIFDAVGERVASGQGFGTGPFWQPPLYTLVLAAVFRVTGHSLAAARLLACVLSSLAAAIACDLGRRATREPLFGLGAGLAVALHGTLLLYDADILPTSLGTFLLTAALWVGLRGAPSVGRALAAGGAMGLTALALPVLALAAPALAWLAAGGRLRRVAASLAAAALVVAPATLYNRARSGEWIPISANGGVNLWLGNNPDSDSSLAIRPGAGWEALVSEPEREGFVTPGAQDRWFASRALRWCARSPADCALGLVRKARLLAASRDLPRNEDIYVLRRQSPVLGALAWRVGPVAFPWALLLPLGAAGVAAAFAWRRGGAGDATGGAPDGARDAHTVRLACALLVLLVALGPVLFFVTGRYRVPMIPALCVMAAVGLQALARRASAAWAACAVAAVLAVWPVRVATDAVDLEAEMHFAVGGRRERRGDAQGAIEAYAEALRRRPDYLEAGFNLGLALERGRRWRAAVAAYDQVLRFHPEMREARYRRAVCLLGDGDLGAAQGELEELVRSDPSDVPAMIGMGQAALLRGDAKTAEAWALRALRASAGRSPEAAALLEMARRARAQGPAFVP